MVDAQFLSTVSLAFKLFFNHTPENCVQLDNTLKHHTLALVSGIKIVNLNNVVTV